MKKLVIAIFVVYSSLLFVEKSFGQADTLMNFCTQHLPPPYISDGQQYKVFVNEGEIAEFKLTFYGGSTYRIVACSGVTDGNLVFTLYDKNRTELYSNRDYKNAPYWDFKFKSTVDCIIEAQLDPKGPTSGWAILLVGFK